MKGLEANTRYTVSANTHYDEHCEYSIDGIPLKKLLADYRPNSVTRIIDMPKPLLDYHKSTVATKYNEPLL